MTPAASTIQKVVAEDIGQELKRFEEAAHGVREDVADSLRQPLIAFGADAARFA